MRELLKKEQKGGLAGKMGDDAEVADMNVTFDFRGKAIMIRKVNPQATKFARVKAQVEASPSKVEKSQTMKKLLEYKLEA